MNKYKEFSIVLDNSSGTYKAGETIKGFVLLELKKTIKLRGIFIKLIGKGDVDWEEDEIQIGYSPKYFTNIETYIDLMVILYGNGPNSSKQIELQEGEHKMPFQLKLPVNIPSSFEHKYGNIKYFLKAIINKPWSIDDKYKYPLKINSPDDLNTQPEAKVAVHKKMSETFGCFGCRRGSLTATIHLKRTGFIPGEKIQMHVEIDNFTDKAVAYTKLTIKKKIRFHTSKKTKIKNVSLISVLGRSIKAGSSISWSDKSLQIPPQTTPHLIYCSIIDVEYTLTFTLCSFWRTLLEIPVKIIIGTIPVQEQHHQRPRITTD